MCCIALALVEVTNWLSTYNCLNGIDLCYVNSLFYRLRLNLIVIFDLLSLLSQWIQFNGKNFECFLFPISIFSIANAIFNICIWFDSVSYNYVIEHSCTLSNNGIFFSNICICIYIVCVPRTEMERNQTEWWEQTSTRSKL